MLCSRVGFRLSVRQVVSRVILRGSALRYFIQRPIRAHIIQSYVRDLTYEGDRWRNVNLIRGEIEENVNLSVLKNKDFSDIEQLCGYMDIMVDACCGQTPTVRINGSEYSRAMVRQRMYELDATHLEYVLERMKECAPKVRNIRAYLLTALYNSYDTIDLYYDAKVSHDMAGAYEDDDD